MKGSEVSPPAFVLPLLPFSRKDNAKVVINQHQATPVNSFNNCLTLCIVMIKERLQEYLRHKHLSTRRFEQICGIGQSVLSKISDSISEDTLGKIEKYSDLDLNWLMTGEGNMLDPDRELASNPQTNIDGVQANGTLSTAIRDIKIEVREQNPLSDISSKRKRQPSAAELQKEIDRLTKLVTDANLEIAKLNGKIEQQNETIKMLLGK